MFRDTSLWHGEQARRLGELNAWLCAQAITTAGQKGARALGQAASVLDEQQKTSAHRAKQWLSGLMQQSEKQAATAQESLEV